jgi:hypothetical protein
MRRLARKMARTSKQEGVWLGMGIPTSRVQEGEPGEEQGDGDGDGAHFFAHFFASPLCLRLSLSKQRRAQNYYGYG